MVAVTDVTKLRLRTLPPPGRALAALFLLGMGAGFVAGQVNLRWQHGGLDGEEGLSYEDVVLAFHGDPSSTVLTSKTRDGGSMAKYIPRPEDRTVLEEWVAGGGTEEGFQPVGGVLDRLCIRCHNPKGEMAQVPFAPSRAEGAKYAMVEPTTAPDRGMSYLSLARSTHAHLFGMSVLYALAGLVFLMTDTGRLTKTVVVSLPFVAMFVDIGCWWLAKWHASFAVGVMAGGALLGVAFAILVLRPLWELATPARAGPPA